MLAFAGSAAGRPASRWRPWVFAGLALALGATLAVVVTFRTTMRADLERVAGRSIVLPSPFGALEYVEGGEGLPVLLAHGAGGGFDMGELTAEVLLGDDFRWIAPSRFGYLGSERPEGAGPELQARAFAWLLDELGVDRVAVVALSAGGPAALHFALLFPERVSSLTLVSAGVTRVTEAGQEDADWKGRALVQLYSRDFLYWAFTKAFEKQFLGIMGANADVVRDLSAEQRSWVTRLIDSMRPVSLRTPGVLVDHRQSLPGKVISGIRAPTLIVHAEDDGLQLFENARFAEATIPGATLLRFPAGGHLVMITEAAVIRDRLREHIVEHAVAPDGS
jgi:2-hydroxy-6-oxonona-2,4-dienedioate hydrolase